MAPVRVKKTRQNKNLEPVLIQSEPALGRAGWPHGLRQQERHALIGIVDRDVDLENPADGLGRDRIRAAAVDGELATVQQHDAVGEAHCQIEVVEHGDDGGAVLRAPSRRFHQVDLVAHVEAGGRLVQQQQAGAVQLFAAGELHQHAGKMRALLLDEPTSSLDMRHQIDLVETAKRRAQNGTAVIAVLHDLNLAMRFADRIVLLHHGRLAVDGGLAEAITAETIRRIFEVEVTIDTTEQGVPFLLPQTMRPTGRPTA